MARHPSPNCTRCGRPRYGSHDRFRVWRRADGRLVHTCAACASASARRYWRRKNPSAGLPRIRFHDLRHTHVSLLAAGGVPVHVISQRVGHASPTITWGIYAHVLPGHQADAAALVARAVFGSSSADVASNDLPTT